MPYGQRSDQLKDDDRTENDRFEQFAALGPFGGQRAGQADGDPRLGQQRQTDMVALLPVELAQFCPQDGAENFAGGSGSNVGNTDDADMAKGFDMQVGSGDDKEGDVKRIVNLAQGVPDQVPAWRAVGQHNPHGQAGQQRIEAEPMADCRTGGYAAEDEDFVLALQLEALRPDGKSEAGCAAKDDRSEQLGQQQADISGRMQQEVGGDGKGEYRDEIVQPDQGQNGTGRRPLSLVLADDHQGCSRSGGDGDDAEED